MLIVIFRKLISRVSDGKRTSDMCTQCALSPFYCHIIGSLGNLMLSEQPTAAAIGDLVELARRVCQHDVSGATAERMSFPLLHVFMCCFRSRYVHLPYAAGHVSYFASSGVDTSDDGKHDWSLICEVFLSLCTVVRCACSILCLRSSLAVSELFISAVLFLL